MEQPLTNKKSGSFLVGGAILVGLCYQLLPYLSLPPIAISLLGPFFNAVLMFVLLALILKTEFWEWFKHFSFKWILIGIPFLIIVGTVFSLLWSTLSGVHIENSVNSVLSWSYVLSNVPFMLFGEELLSLAVLYGTWKKWGWTFWQATLLCAVLFALWHLPSYGFNLLQCLVTIIPSRLVLNYLFKKSNSIWVTFIVHLAFDVFSFLPILLK